MSSLSHAPPILPLTNSPLASRRFRSTSRRISYTLKNRAGRYAVPLSVGSIIALVFLTLTWSRSPAHHYPSHRVQLYTREQIEQATFGPPSQLTDPYDNAHAPRPGRLPNKGDGDANGVSSLVESEEELIAEDDLFWMNYKEPTPLTDKEKEANKEMEAHRLDVIQRNAVHSLKALIWWMAEGGVIPSGWEVPSKSYFEKFGGRGMERLLNGIDQGKQDRKGRGEWKPVSDKDDEESVFTEGWGDFAKEQLKLVVFSKTYCPYSKRAKAILSKYSLTPSPYIIELDRRADTGAIQNLLFHLTGRRTVPNTILDFKSLGGADELTLLDAEGGLQRTFDSAGLIKPLRNAYLPEYFGDAAEEDKPYIHVPEDLRDDDDEDDIEIDEVTRDEEHAGEIDVERRRPNVQGKPAQAAGKAPAAVDIEAAVRQAHQAVDRREGYGAFQPQGWRDVPDAVLYAEPDILPRRPGVLEDASDLEGRSGAKAARERAALDKPLERGEAIPPALDRQAAERDTVKARRPVQAAREADESTHDAAAVPPEPLAQNPVFLEALPPTQDEPSQSASDPWGDVDPWSMSSEPRPQEATPDEATSTTLDVAHPYPPMEFSWPETSAHSDDKSQNSDSASLETPQQERDHQVDAPIERTDTESKELSIEDQAIPKDVNERAVHQGDDQAVERAPVVQQPALLDRNAARAPLEPVIAAAPVDVAGSINQDQSVSDARRLDETSFEEDDEEMDIYYDPEPRDTRPRYDPVNQAKQYEVRGRNQQVKDRQVGVPKRDPPTLADRGKADASKNELAGESFVKAPEPRRLEADGVAALSAAANLRRRPSGRRLRTAVDTAELL